MAKTFHRNDKAVSSVRSWRIDLRGLRQVAGSLTGEHCRRRLFRLSIGPLFEHSVTLESRSSNLINSKAHHLGVRCPGEQRCGSGSLLAPVGQLCPPRASMPPLLRLHRALAVKKKSENARRWYENQSQLIALVRWRQSVSGA
jgi:hypothetical protein